MGMTREDAERSLPKELRTVFNSLVEEYMHYSRVTYGRGFVSYEVLSDLVRAGWRPSGPRLPERTRDAT